MVYVTQLHCMKIILDHHYLPQRSCKSYVFTGVFFNGGGEVSAPGRAWSRGGGAWSRGVAWSWKGAPGPRGLLWGGGAWSLGGCLVWGRAWSQGSAWFQEGLVSQHALWQTPQERRLLLRTVRILLECILVPSLF